MVGVDVSSVVEGKNQLRGASLGLLAAALFGLSTPIAKGLLNQVGPVLLAGLLYLGAAVGLWLHRVFTEPSLEAPLDRKDVWRLALVVLVGGIGGPVLMLHGLSRVTSLTGSLLVNLEAPLTVLFAVTFFREHLGRSGAAAVALIFVGAAVLKVEPGALGADAQGVLCIAAACGCWALDNNWTQRLSLKDPFAIARTKTLAAGLTNTVLGLGVSSQLPSPSFVLGAMVVGSLSYGVSIVLDAYALRLVGAVREAAYFATAPFIGALASVLVNGDTLRLHDFAALAAMAGGVAFLLAERHAHQHLHDEFVHEHLHEHDEHHRHAHEEGEPDVPAHSHVHRHAPLLHDHRHVSDAHHRHRH